MNAEDYVLVEVKYKETDKLVLLQKNPTKNDNDVDYKEIAKIKVIKAIPLPPDGKIEGIPRDNPKIKIFNQGEYAIEKANYGFKVTLFNNDKTYNMTKNRPIDK